MSAENQNESPWPKVAVMGAGAVGSYFGFLLARAGADVTLIGRHSHVEAITRNGLYLDSIHFKEAIKIKSTTDLGAIRSADIVLFCVKSQGSETAASMMQQYLRPDSIVLSMQNGVDNVDVIRETIGVEAIAAAVYVAVQFSAAGKLKHNGRGELIIGYIGSQQDESKLDLVCQLFTRANIQCRISNNIKGELWAKLIINCAYNAISALTQSNYTSMMSNQLIKDMMISVVEECQAIVKADGVTLPDENILEPVLALANSMGNAVSSTAQDLARGKATEIDAFNGYVRRRGLALGIPTPVNTTLYSLVKHLEKSLVK